MMIRFRVSTVFLFASALAGSLLLIQVKQQAYLLLGGFTLFLVSAGNVLFCMPSSSCAAPSSCAASSAGIKGPGLKILALCLGIVFGILRSASLPWNQTIVATGIPIEEVAGFRGYLVEDSFISKKGNTVYTLRLASVWSKMEDRTAEAQGRVVIVLDQGSKMYWGRIIRVHGGLFKPDSPSADYLLCLNAQKIKPCGFFNSIFRLRFRLRVLLNKQFRNLNTPVSAMLIALVFGDREEVPDHVYEQFRTSGVLHILALSGLHVGILLFLVYLIFSFIPGKAPRLLIGFLFALLYLFLVGPRASLLRTVIMLIIGGIAFFLDRDYEPLNILAIAASIILLFDPNSVLSLSFQLSFLALLGILMIGPGILRFITPYIPPLFGLPIAYSLAAQLATTPLLLARFGIVFPIGVIASIIVIPLITVFIWTGLLYLFISCFSIPFVSQLLSRFLSLIYDILLKSITLCSKAHGIRISWIEYLCFLIFLILIPVIFSFSKRRLLS